MNIVLFGTSANPPTRAHRLAAEQLARVFDRVVVIPCGIRPDKHTTNVVSVVHRARMCQMAFSGIPNVEIDLSDLERTEFMTTVELDRHWKRREPGADIWHAVGSDLIRGGRSGASDIQREWREGSTVWQTLRFAVIPRQRYPFSDDDLPTLGRVMAFEIPDHSSTEARRLLSSGQNASDIVSRRVAEYALRFGLYGFAPGSRTEGRLLLPSGPSLFVVPDLNNPAAVRRARRLTGQCERPEDADMIVAIGGDGHMLHVIRQTHRHCVPILGLNAGHVGFLLNELSPEALKSRIAAGVPFTTHLLPMLAVSIRGIDGTWGDERLAFQDAWLERSGEQTARFKIGVEGRRTRAFQITSDAILGSNPAGSGAYAGSMGAPLIPLNSASLILAAGCVARPRNWTPKLLANGTRLTFEAMETEKRPVRAVIDGLGHGPAIGMRIRQSVLAGVELAFDPELTLDQKIEDLSFPA